MKRLLGKGKGKGIGVGIGVGMGMGEGTRRVRFDEFITYIQENYRINLNSRDYEVLQTIADNYSAKEIMLAIDYCKQKKTDSLFYLQDALTKKYYQSEKQVDVPNWFEDEIKTEPLSEDDKKWLRNFYKKYCDTEEEYYEELKINGLED